LGDQKFGFKKNLIRFVSNNGIKKQVFRDALIIMGVPSDTFKKQTILIR